MMSSAEAAGDVVLGVLLAASGFAGELHSTEFVMI
jgi:hypothetical protein